MRRIVPVLLAGLLVGGAAGSASASLPCDRIGEPTVRRACQAVDPSLSLCFATVDVCVEVCSAILDYCLP